eukprot:8240318-Prorocentrum_lima.AAC.1
MQVCSTSSGRSATRHCSSALRRSSTASRTTTGSSTTRRSSSCRLAKLRDRNAPHHARTKGACA